MREGEKIKPRLLPEVKRARDKERARANPPPDPAFLASIGRKGGVHSGEVRKAKAALQHVGEVQLWFGAWVPEAVGLALRADSARLGRPMGQYLAQILTDYCEVRRRPKVRLRREFPKPW